MVGGTGGRVVVVGSANVDLFFRTDSLPAPGETVAAKSTSRSFGGKGANQAVTVAKLGGSAAMVCRVGKDQAGDELLENFRRFGVDTRFAIRDSGTPSGMAFITVDRHGENTIVIYSGSNGRLSPDDVETAHGVMEKAGVVVAQLEIPLETVRKAAEAARGMGVPFILNPAPAPSRDIGDILANVDLLCPNASEASALTGMKIDGIDGAKEAGRKLMRLGIGTVVLTLGKSGALLMREGGAEHIPSPEVSALDTTGAGDAFVGALALSMANGSGIDEAVRFANVAAAISVTKEGTQAGLPTFEEVEAMKKDFFS
jgi:ribokinase